VADPSEADGKDKNENVFIGAKALTSGSKCDIILM
jgi:hypothetical protein